MQQLLTQQTIKGALEWATARLELAGLESPETEAVALMSGLLKRSPTLVYANLPDMLTPDQDRIFAERVERRSRFEPVAYIEGVKSFWGRDFFVDSRVLIPRPETEILVTEVDQYLRKKGLSAPRILDIGTGSGCIPVTLAHGFPEAEIVAVDLSEGALSVAQSNAQQFGVENRIRFFKSNIFDALQASFKGYFDMIVSNPPYISMSDQKGLPQDLAFEPQMALFGGADGTTFIQEIISEGPLFLRSDAAMALEIGAGQAGFARDFMKMAGFDQIQTFKDYSGWDRIVLGEQVGSI